MAAVSLCAGVETSGLPALLAASAKKVGKEDGSGTLLAYALLAAHLVAGVLDLVMVVVASNADNHVAGGVLESGGSVPVSVTLLFVFTLVTQLFFTILSATEGGGILGTSFLLTGAVFGTGLGALAMSAAGLCIAAFALSSEAFLLMLPSVGLKATALGADLAIRFAVLVRGISYREVLQASLA